MVAFGVQAQTMAAAAHALVQKENEGDAYSHIVAMQP